MGYKQQRSRKPFTLKIAQLRMTDAMSVLEEIIMTSEDEHTRINAINALSGLVSRYAKLAETTDLEKRLSELEKRSKSHLRTVKTGKSS